MTGALVISEGAFAQALEGDEAVVRELYEHISHDERHERVTLLEADAVEGRTFGRWAMAKVAEDGVRTFDCSATPRRGGSSRPGRMGMSPLSRRQSSRTCVSRLRERSKRHRPMLGGDG